MCRHEWCWICKEDFPVHLSSCPNYQQYLDILVFQGNDLQIAMNSNMWYFKSSQRGSAIIWILTSLLLLLLGLPGIICFNLIATPCLVIAMIQNYHRSKNRRTGKCCFAILIILGVFMYALAPVIFFIVTVP